MKCEECKHYSQTESCGKSPCSGYGFVNFEPKETKMKPQFTEEEARELFKFLTPYHYDKDVKRGIDRLRDAGYIRKSDLEILIEEAEENYRKVKNYSYSPEFGNSINLLYNCIQAMKTELSKRKDK